MALAKHLNAINKRYRKPGDNRGASSGKLAERKLARLSQEKWYSPSCQCLVSGARIDGGGKNVESS